MKKLYLFSFAIACSLIGIGSSEASSIIPLSPEQHVSLSAAVFRGTVLNSVSFIDPNDNLIYTRTTLRVDEGLKGIFPTAINVVHRGGDVGKREEFFGLSPRFRPGGEYLLFVMRAKNGQLNCTQGSASAMQLSRQATTKSGTASFIPEHEALLEQMRGLARRLPPGDDVTDQAGSAIEKLVTGLLVDGAGKSSRFLPQDWGEPIGYLVDTNTLPTGITVSVASNAVRQALSAWSAVTSLRFRFDGYQNFGAGADTLNATDQRLYLQLHDNWNRINTPNVLGIGGRPALSAPTPSGWDLGGSVGTNDFRKTTYGYVVLENSAVSLQNAATLAEVLCHEIGHALSMAHSSEVSTTNPTLTNSIMYFQAHADGRGATLGAYDPPVIQQAYPSNTPPYTFDRMLDVTSASSNPNVPGINEVEIRGYDLQTSSASLTVQTADPSNLNGTFSLLGFLLKFIPAGNFPDTARIDPTDGGSWDDIFYRFSDGTNSSPYGEIRVLSFNHDGFTPSDGIPDNWMITYFANANPNTGLNHHATEDADGDKMSNLQEYRAGMDPTQSASAQRVTLIPPNSIQFQAKGYELYELHASTNLTNWARILVPQVPTNSIGTFTGITNTAPRQFFRVLKVP
jgi:hypothetical protein